MDFLADLDHLARQELSILGFASKPQDDLDVVLIRYYNMKSRIPGVSLGPSCALPRCPVSF
jgi:hypothetical protein